jgi:hypothetical protein
MSASAASPQDLLGDEFRRQMMMDGQFGAISFVCTKASAGATFGSLRFAALPATLALCQC